MALSKPQASTAWLCLLPEAKPPSQSPRFQFYIHTLKTFGKSKSSLAICLSHFYYIYNKKKNQEEIEFRLQITCCLPGSWDPPSKATPQGRASPRPCSREHTEPAPVMPSCSAHRSPGKQGLSSPSVDELRFIERKLVIQGYAPNK